MTHQDAEESAAILARSFSETGIVTLEGREPFVFARKQNKLALSPKCPHAIRITAKNVYVAVTKEGYLTGGQRAEPMLAAKVEYCQRCEVVFSIER